MPHRAGKMDLKSFFAQAECGFKSRPGHHLGDVSTKVLGVFVHVVVLAAAPDTARCAFLHLRSHAMCPGCRNFQYPKTGATIRGMERRNSLLLVLMGIGAIAVGLQAAGDQKATYTVRTVALPDHGKGTSQWITSLMIPGRDMSGSPP